MKEIMDIIGIQEANSVDFVRTVFHYFNEGIPVAIIKESQPSDEILNYKDIIVPNKQGGWLDVHQPVILEDVPAQVVFTSGTEGRPKAILLNHSTLQNTVKRLNDVMGVDESIKEYIGVPVHYSFGFGRCRAVASVGGNAYIPENGFNPVEIRNMLENDEINSISAVPTLWRLILENKNIIGEQGKKVKWIEIGSQYMSADEKSSMIKLFPNATIVQHYGLTEASRSCFLVVNKTPEKYLESVGQFTNGVELKVSSEGRVKIRGEHVADGIFDGEKFESLLDDEGWLLTNDLGHIQDGYLYYDGRSDDLINCAGIKINPDTIQNELEQRLNLSNKVAISKYQCKVRGEGFLIAVLNNVDVDESRLSEEMTKILERYSINAKSSVKILHLDEFPCTQTGKIQRKKITEIYQASSSVSIEPIIEKYDNYLYQEYANVFPGQKILTDSTFSNLGGDSLNYVQVSMFLEEYLGYLPKGWENTDIDRLSKLSRVKKSFFSEVESSIVLRVIAIFAVVLTHSGFRYAGGGTLLLFMLIGYNMGRFKHSEFVSTGSWNWFKTYAVKILIPYTVLSVMFMSYHMEFDLSTILLVTNLIELDLTVAFPFWFVQVLIQSLLVISVMFSFSLIREKLKKNPFEIAVFILFVFLLIRISYPLIWDTSYLRNLVPQRFIVLIWLGYCFSFVTTFKQKLFMVVIGILVAYLDVGKYFTIHWLIIGSLILSFLPRIKVPNISKSVIYTIANSTFYIFIFNGIVLSVLFKYSGLDSRVVMSVITMVSCVIIWKLSVYIDIENKVIGYFNRSRN